MARDRKQANVGWNAAVTHSPEETEMNVNVEDRGDHFYITAASVQWPHGSSLRSR